MFKYIAKIAAVMLIAAVMTPTLALANERDDRRNDQREDRKSDQKRGGAWTTNEFGVKVLNSNDNNDKKNRGKHLGEFRHKGFFPGVFYNGTVTATSSTGFIIKTKDDTTVTVDADTAKIIQIPRTEINLSGIEVGDTVHITGNKTSDTGVNAMVVYVLPANLNPAIAKGEVTEVDGNTLTVQTKDDTTVTVNTDADTVITNSEGEIIEQTDIEVGMKAKVIGLWDSVLNVFNAVKIKLF